jgi:hypothetical protein
VVVKSDRPTFHWKALDGAVSYTVAILDKDFNEVISSEPLTTTSWTPPRALARGKVYLWQVTALKDGKRINSPSAPAPEARFKVLGQAELGQINRIIQSQPESHLALGIVYLRDGLLDEAESEFKSLAKANPDSPVARKLLQQVQALRHRR